MNDAAIDDWLDYNNLELKDLDSIDITNLRALDYIPYSRDGIDELLEECNDYLND